MKMKFRSRWMALAALALCAGIVRADYYVWWKVSGAAEEYKFTSAAVAYKTAGSDSYGAFLQFPNQVEGVGYVDMFVNADATGLSTAGESKGMLLTAPEGSYGDTLLQIWLFNELNEVVGKSAGEMSLQALQNIGAAGETTDISHDGLWTAKTFVVPEPTSGLLLLLGLAGLALKRRNGLARA